ncbi:hypothetical protein [uncultured Kordia sp.]|uniref:hypothetical protein n=1 Tax=uncultured Kordia sp. TaxID=507699 RepID=UPI002636008E|nr:hypothetical protein [uncultured Kordia sp.]
MKKKREITLKLKKVKIANLSKLSSIMGGNTNNCNNDNTGDPGTDEDSRKICKPNDGNPPATYTMSCPTVCPSFVESKSIC